MRGLARWRRALATAVLVVMAGAVIWVLAGNIGGGPWEPSALPPLAVSPPAKRSIPTRAPQATPPAVAVSTTPAPPVRLVIPAIGVDAPVTVKGLRPDGAMDLPNGPEDVAWYNFTSRPGTGGNAVFSGHLDYRNYGAAVFWRLKDLRQGDIVEVRLDDGSALRYQVSLKTTYEARTAPVAEITGPASKEVLTLITCGGTFDSASRNYSQRLVVRAERI